MRHQQIIDKLATSRELIQAMDGDISRRTGELMLGRPKAPEEMRQRLVPPVLARWRCLLDADDASGHTKDKVRVALATLLHKYGFQDEEVTSEALRAVDDLNHGVVLSDAFARQSPAIKTFLRSPPVPLTRRPRRVRPATFLRVGDVVSIELGGCFHAAYVLALHRDSGGTFPVIEFYEGRFDRVPSARDLTGRAMVRERGRGRFGVAGLTYLPDPANQVVAIENPQSVAPPQGLPPGPADGLWSLTDLLRLQDHITTLYGPLP